MLQRGRGGLRLFQHHPQLPNPPRIRRPTITKPIIQPGIPPQYVRVGAATDKDTQRIVVLQNEPGNELRTTGLGVRQQVGEVVVLQGVGTGEVQG